jgi:hypothetical protein
MRYVVMNLNMVILYNPRLVNRLLIGIRQVVYTQGTHRLGIDIWEGGAGEWTRD